jgi:hypothetical protein
MSRTQVAKIWHKLRAWDRDNHRSSRHGGLLTHVDLKVYYALAFDFLNYTTGRLDPSLDAIARKARCCRRSVVNALRRLAELGLIAWQRRCEEGRDPEGHFRLHQRTNAYAILPSSQWRGYRDKAPPPPSPDTLGAPERVPDPMEAAVTELTHGQRKAVLAALEADPRDALAMAFAAFYRAMDEREAREITGVQPVPRNTTPDSNQTGTDRLTPPKLPPKPPEEDLKALKTWHIQRLLGTEPDS